MDEAAAKTPVVGSEQSSAQLSGYYACTRRAKCVPAPLVRRHYHLSRASDDG